MKGTHLFLMGQKMQTSKRKNRLVAALIEEKTAIFMRVPAIYRMFSCCGNLEFSSQMNKNDFNNKG